MGTMTKNEKLTLFISVLSLITAISFSILTIYQNYIIAERSGNFDKASPQLLFDQVLLQPNIQNHLYLGINNYDSLNGIILLPLTIFNQGRKSAKIGKVLISYNYNKSIFMPEEEIGKTIQIENYVPREVIQSKVSIQSLYTLTTIEPNSVRFINEYIKIPKQILDTFTRSVMTGENELSEFSELKTKQYLLRIELSFEDLTTCYYDLSLHFTKNLNASQLQTEVLKEIKKTKEIVPKRFSLIIANPEVTTFTLRKGDTVDVLDYKIKNMEFGIYDEVTNTYFQNDKEGNLIKTVEN